MSGMRVDHVSYAAEHDGLQATAERLAKLIGVDPVDGGIHPRFGTRNVILPLGARALRRGRRGPGPPRVRQGAVRPGRPRPVRGRRRLARLGASPSTTSLPTRSASAARPWWATGTAPMASSCAGASSGVKGLMSDPQLPYFIQWDDATLHPSTAAHDDGHHRQPPDRRRPRAGARLAGPAARRDLLGHRLHLRRPARHPRPAGGHLRHPGRQGHRLTALVPERPARPRSPRGVVVSEPGAVRPGSTRSRAPTRSGEPPAASRSPPRPCLPTASRPRRRRRPPRRTRRGTPGSPRRVRR